MKKIVFVALALFALNKSYAQNELTFPLFENVLQSAYINPAHVPEHKLSIGLPGISSIYLGATNTGFTYKDITYKVQDTVHLKTNDIPSMLKKENYLYNSLNVDLFSIRVKIRHFYWSFNVTEKVTSRISYPQDFIKLLVNGNQSFIGNEVSFANTGVNISHFREYGLGIVKQHSNFVYGVRLKYLQGLSNVYFKTNNLALKTGQADDNYAMEVNTDATIYTSGVDQGSGDFNVSKYLNNYKNPGVGIDLGFTYKVSKHIVLSGAVNNIGAIRWSDKVSNYNIKGGSKFRGADLGRDYLQTIDSSNQWSSIGNKYLDSLRYSFETSTTHEKYTTFLIPQLYLTAKYVFSHKTHAAFTFYLEKYIAFRPAFSLAMYQEVGRWLNVVGSYSVQYGQFNNFGLGFVIKPPGSPIQFYLCGDQILSNYYSVNGSSWYAPLDRKAYNIRTGINLVFGSVKLHDKQPYPHKKINIFE